MHHIGSVQPRRAAPDLKALSRGMHAACRPGVSLEQLCKCGVSVDAVDHYGRTALYVAAASGDINAMKRLIKAGASITLANPFDGRTPLHAACAAGHAQAALLLLHAGSSASKRDANCRTPIECASDAGHSDIVAALFNAQFLPDL
eukprot:6181731-Pleurochrysis_carterae.AAC.1